MDQAWGARSSRLYFWHEFFAGSCLMMNSFILSVVRISTESVFSKYILTGSMSVWGINVMVHL